MSSKLTFKLKDLIQEQSLSIQGLEKKAGLKIHAVRNILTGQTKRPSAETLLAVARVLNCSIGELLDEEPPVKDNQDNTESLAISSEVVNFHNLSLLLAVMSFTVSYYRKNERLLTSRVLAEALPQVYAYSVKNNESQLDEGFANWFLDREFEAP